MTRPPQPNPESATAAEILDYCEVVGKEAVAGDLSNRYAREAGALSAFVNMLCRHRDTLAVRVRKAEETV